MRSGRGHFVKVSGLGWVCPRCSSYPGALGLSGMGLAPFLLSVLAPSERYARERGNPHNELTDRARQMLLLVGRRWPEREIVAVADSGRART